VVQVGLGDIAEDHGAGLAVVAGSGEHVVDGDSEIGTVEAGVDGDAHRGEACGVEERGPHPVRRGARGGVREGQEVVGPVQERQRCGVGEVGGLLGLPGGDPGQGPGLVVRVEVSGGIGEQAVGVAVVAVLGCGVGGVGHGHGHGQGQGLGLGLGGGVEGRMVFSLTQRTLATCHRAHPAVVRPDCRPR
jgi:hypothetical protein